MNVVVILVVRLAAQVVKINITKNTNVKTVNDYFSFAASIFKLKISPNEVDGLRACCLGRDLRRGAVGDGQGREHES